MILQNQDFNWDQYETYIGGNRLTQNKKIKGQGGKTRVFSFESYAQELFNIITGDNRKVIKKDLLVGDMVKIVDVFPGSENNISIELEGGLVIDIDMSREKKFVHVFGHDDHKKFIQAFYNAENKKNFINGGLEVYVTDIDPVRVSLWQGYVEKTKKEFQDQIGKPTKAYVAKIMEANKGGYFVEVQGVDAFMPGSLAAPNKIHDFRDLLGKEVIVMVEDYIKEMNSFIVSHKKYIEHVLPIKIKELDMEKSYSGLVTGTSKYGIFVEFEDIFTGLLHTSKMTPATSADFVERKFKSGDKMDFYINEITKDNRIILTEENPEERRGKKDRFIEENKNKIIEGSIVAVMDFGVIVNFGDISGLLPNKELRKSRNPGQALSVRDKISVMISDLSDDKIIFKLPKHELANQR